MAILATCQIAALAACRLSAEHLFRLPRIDVPGCRNLKSLNIKPLRRATF